MCCSQLQSVTDLFGLPKFCRVPVCRWRKYGEKCLVGSCAPRLYFKCSHKACQAKKHVQVGLAITPKAAKHDMLRRWSLSDQP